MTAKMKMIDQSLQVIATKANINVKENS
jgi:hypothetical protein